MTFKQICQLGFTCPYNRISEDGPICIYPYIRITELEENETFSFTEDMDCPLLDCDSPLADWKDRFIEEVIE